MINEEILLTADNCRYCLMCRHVCSVGHVTALETLTPHGWALLIASQRRGLLDWNQESVSKLFSCADCGTCQAHCVTDQPLPHTIAVARSQVVAQNLAPDIIYALNEKLCQWENPYREQAPQTIEGRGPVALFVGDEAAYVWPPALEAALTLLEAIGIEPVLIGVGRNSGYMASSLGLPETARNLAQANLDELISTGAEQLLVLNPGDYFTFKQLYPERLDLHLPQGVVLSEVISILAEALDEKRLLFDPLPPAAPHAYVDPSHSVRVPSRFKAPRRLVAAVLPDSPRELFWRRERAHPVGSTALQFSEPQLADHLTLARLDDARQAGAQHLICEDPGTLRALSNHAGRFGLNVSGLYELLATRLV